MDGTCARDIGRGAARPGGITDSTDLFMFSSRHIAGTESAHAGLDFVRLTHAISRRDGARDPQKRWLV